MKCGRHLAIHWIRSFYGYELQAKSRDPLQWAQVRTRAFKKWFGDWEKTARLAKLRKSKEIEISGNEVPITGDWKADLKAAQAYAKKFRGEYVNKDTGKTIPLFGGGINELSQHDVKDNAHLQSFAAIPKIIQNGIYIDTLPNEDAKKHPGIKEFEYYVCGLKINGEDYTVKAVVAVGKNGERYYDHKLTQIEKGALLSMLTDVSKPEQKKARAPLSGIKDKRLLSLLQANSSSVVDKNGEPLVVYHGTDADFTVFDRAKMGSNFSYSGNGGLGGFFFSTKQSLSHGKTMPVFLNIRNAVSGSADVFDNNSDSLLREAFGDEDVVDCGIIIPSSPEFMAQGDLYIVSSPNQIKSATDNTGAFDGSNPDIRFQRELIPETPEQEQGREEREKQERREEARERKQERFTLRDRRLAIRCERL